LKTKELEYRIKRKGLCESLQRSILKTPKEGGTISTVMQIKISPIVTSVIGIVLCVLLMLTALSMQRKSDIESHLSLRLWLAENSLMLTERSLRQFNAARIVVMQYRQANDLTPNEWIAMVNKVSEHAGAATQSIGQSRNFFRFTDEEYRFNRDELSLELFDLYPRFAIVFHEESQIHYNEIRRAEGDDERLKELLAIRQKLQEQQNDIIAKVEAVFTELSEQIGSVIVREHAELTRSQSFPSSLLFSSIVFFLFFCIMACFVALRELCRKPS